MALIPSLRRSKQQSNEKEIWRDIYVKPSKEFGIEPEKVLNIRKLWYGFAENHDYWSRTISIHLIEELEINNCNLGPTIYFEHGSNLDLNCTLPTRTISYILERRHTEYVRGKRKVFPLRTKELRQYGVSWPTNGDNMPQIDGY